MDIDKRILNDTEFLADFELCQLRLYKDGDLDWFVLIPRVAGIIDWIDLDPSDQIQMTKEIDKACQLLKKYTDYDKINVASLGNMVPQMHIHIIARHKNDRAWPNAIWGTKSKIAWQPYMHKDWLKRIS
jgi:diadenosine tetraphosphate (Ap4A) HIT family hydrolase